MSKSKIPENEYINIIDLYQEGFSQQKIADMYDVSHSTIGKILKDNNINCTNIKIKKDEYDNIVNLYLSGCSLSQIADIYNTCGGTISKVLKCCGVDCRPPEESNRKYLFNEHYFDEVNTKNKAYILGLLYADGCNYPRNNGIRLELQERDKEILEKINKEINNEKPLKFYNRSKITNGAQDTYTIELFSKYFSDTLAKKGVVPRKSFILTFPEWLDESLYSSFLLGYSDGDGCISKDITRANWSIVSTNEFCQSVANILVKELGIDKYNIYAPSSMDKNKNTRVLYITGKNRVKTVLVWFYNDAELYLQRKYDIYKSIYCNET